MKNSLVVGTAAAALLIQTSSRTSTNVLAQTSGSSVQPTSTQTGLVRPAEWSARVKDGSLKSKAAIYREGWIDFNKNGKRDDFEDSSQPIEKRIENLLSQMTVNEKTCQLATLYGFGRVLKDPLPTPAWKNEIWKDGIANIDEMHNGVSGSGNNNPHAWPPSSHARALNEVQRWFIEETRLGIPVDFTNEGIRGLNAVRSTNFPAQIGIGATWNRDLVSRIGQIVGREGHATGFTHIYSPIMDLARDPRWGRIVECYGEDPYHVAELGIRQAIALRKEGVAVSAKHFAVYSEPKGGRDGRVRTDPHIAPREMEMLHLWPWERLVKEAGLLGVMSSYNDYDGVAISGSREFLIDRLRKQWGFKGYVVSDSAAVEDLHNKHRIAPTVADAQAMFILEGGNVRTQFNPPQVFLVPIRKQIAEGKIPMRVVDDRVRDVLRVKFLEGLFDKPYVADPAYADTVMHAPEHQAVALQAARESIVLLKNDKQTLPLAKNLKSILVCGPTAKMTATSFDRYGSLKGSVATVLDGITAAVGTGTEVVYAQGSEVSDARWPESELYPEPPSGNDSALIAEAVQKAANVDAIVVSLGDSNNTIGEAKSRTSLDLPGYQTDLVKALIATGKPVVVVLLSGRPATINWINRYAPAILQGWFPGEAGGHAIADVIFGNYNPGGKLPVTFPRTVGQLPMNFPFKPSSQVGQGRTVDPNGWGNSLADGVLYPFGYGMSYTTFEYSNLNVSPKSLKTDGTVTVSCSIKNTGSRAGDEIAQMYVQDVYSSVTTYDLNLRGFERVHLQPGETKTVTFKMPARFMELINRQGKRVVEPGDFKVMVGASSEDIRLNGTYTIVK